MKAQRHARAATVATLYRRERGVVLIITLIMLVVMSLAGIAVVRSVDATSAVAGNLALRQASIEPANLAVENAAAALFADATKAAVAIPDPTADFLSQNYFAARQPGEDGRGVPLKLQEKSNFDLPLVLSDGAGNEIRYVIERLCIAAGAATPGNCETMLPAPATGGTVGEETLALPRTPFYRVTIRVDGPQNSASFVQAMLH